MELHSETASLTGTIQAALFRTIRSPGNYCIRQVQRQNKEIECDLIHNSDDALDEDRQA